MPFACIYAPNFPVAAALRAEPELRARAVAILEGKPPLEKVFAVNEKAGRIGIAPGMTRAQAELCPEMALRMRSAVQESAAHAALLDCAQSFSPCVEDAAADTVILDLAGMESLFGPPFEIAGAISTRAAGLGLAANVAAASNPDTAVLAARGFPGVTVIFPGKEAEQLGPLPVEVLFAGGSNDGKNQRDEKKEAERLLETLERWGVRNLCALAALPEVALSERLGQEGVRLRRLARGAASRTLVPVEAPPVFEEAVELEHAIVLLEPLAFLLNRLIEQLCARLASRTLATQELRLTLELDNFAGMDCEGDNQGIPSESDGSGGDTAKLAQNFISTRAVKFCRTLRLPLPMLDARLFLKLLQLDLNAHPPGAPIVKIHLAAEPARQRKAQAGLFQPPIPEPEKLELTLARIADMVGEDKVGAIDMLDTHHPEGFRMRHFVSTQTFCQPGPRAPARSGGILPDTAVTSLRRFRPPVRASVTIESGQPVRLLCARKKEVQG